MSLHPLKNAKNLHIVPALLYASLKKNIPLFGMVIVSIMSFPGLGKAQVSSDFAPLFKTAPIIDEDTPNWAKQMYSDNPDVGAIDMGYATFKLENPGVKTQHTRNYDYWRRNIIKLAYQRPNGSFRKPTKEEYRQAFKPRKKSTRKSNHEWTPIGPIETFDAIDKTKKSSQVNIYTIDQSLSHPNIVYSGTEDGAIFKSTDKGDNWFCLSDTIPEAQGIFSVKVHPTNPDIVYAGKGSRVLKSIDGGAKWTEFLDSLDVDDRIHDIEINPADPSIVFVGSSKGMFRIDASNNVVRQYDSLAVYDFNFRPGDANVVYALIKSQVDNAGAYIKFHKSTDKGISFAPKESGWYTPTTTTSLPASDEGARMAVTPADPDVVYVALLGNDISPTVDMNWLGLYKSTNAGESWTLPIGDPGGPYDCATGKYPLSGFNRNDCDLATYNQGFYNLGLAISPTDPDDVLLGMLTLWRTTDGGATYKFWGGYNNSDNPDKGYSHPDIQEIEINGGDIWIASDGGIDLYESDLSSHTAKNKGINATQYWGFGSGWNDDLLVGGRYHNGNAVWRPAYADGQVLEIGGGEAWTGYVNAGMNSLVHVSDGPSRIMPETFGGPVVNKPKLAEYPNEGYFGSKSEIVTDPRYYNH